MNACILAGVQGGFYLENLTSRVVNSEQDALAAYASAMQATVLAAHDLNAASSRSHVVLQLTVTAHPPSAPELAATATLQMVDLAGCERQRLTGVAAGSTARAESVAINQSLHTLRKVFAALAKGTDAPPYRESKLTSLLKQGLGGAARAVVIACLHDRADCLEDNWSTLQYAALVRSILAGGGRHVPARPR